MDFRFNTEEEAFREQFRDWLDIKLSKDVLRPDYRLPEDWTERVRLYKVLQRQLYDAGYAGLTCPEEYGGRGNHFIKHIIVTEELAPWTQTIGHVGLISHGMALPTLLTCGSEDQKKELVPKILKGEHVWCQGSSEPNAGSDIANIQTRAVRDGNYYIINGQKIWTSEAHVADYCLLMVRTDPDAPKHAGLSYFVLDMKTPGIEVRPILQMTGEAEHNEVFFEDVRIHKSRMVGKENEGWKVILTNLMFERVSGGVSMIAGCKCLYDGVVDMAGRFVKDGKPAIKDAFIRRRLAKCYIDLMVGKYMGYRSISKIAGGSMPGPDESASKLLASELSQRLLELAMDVQGPYNQYVSGPKWIIDNGRWQYEYLYSKGTTIGGGTSEILRNIIGERVLGLPKG
jgi:alkylation response protein AidB-like acyl-CoA dehydrogenase